MSRAQLWVEIRYRLVILGVATLVVGSMAVALRGSIHAGPAQPYQPHAIQPYEAHLVAWKTGSAAVAGWSRSNEFVDCPRLLIWVLTGDKNGYIDAGPVAADQTVGWSGWLHDVHGHLVPITTAPVATPSCQ